MLYQKAEGSLPPAGMCKAAFALTPGSSDLSDLLGVNEPTIAAEVDEKFLNSAQRGLETVFTRVISPPDGAQGPVALIIAIATKDGHELRIAADVTDPDMRTCIVENDGQSYVKFLLFSNPYITTAHCVFFNRDDRDVINGAGVQTTAVEQYFREVSVTSMLLCDVEKYPYMSSDIRPKSVRSCMLITEFNHKIYIEQKRQASILMSAGSLH